MMNAPQQPSVASRPPPKQLDANQLRLLEQQGFTNGLIQAVSHYVNTIPLRIWVIDNSVSMQVRDGHRISGSTFQNLTKTNCTRWEEAYDDVAFHAYMAACLGLPTRFNLANANIQSQVPSCFSIGEQGPARVQQELQMAKQIMGQVQPVARATPLADHLRQIRGMVVQMAPQLEREGKAVSVVIATSGLPTDLNGQCGPNVYHEFVQALRMLEGLPVWVVVRLCTDDEQVVDFYNTLDVQITNLSYDVLDDFFGESLEIYLKNPFLNYAMPLHRFRQFGFSIPVFDELDERALSFHELHQFCSILFHTQPPQSQPLPDPAVNWIMFLRALHSVLMREKMHFNPISKNLSPWIDLRRLHHMYGGNLPFPSDISPPMAPQQQFQQQPQGYSHQQQPPRQGQSQWQQSPPPPHQSSFQQQPGRPAATPSPHAESTPAPAPDANVCAKKYSEQAVGDTSMTEIKHAIIRWATAPPTHQHLRTIDQLLGTIPQTFPPAFGITDHAYFKKWKPFAMNALQDRDSAVLKRAMRKTKFFLHPDKLPQDLTKEQSLLCKMLWDIVADAWEAFGGDQ